jgi:hypothetical protein
MTALLPIMLFRGSIVIARSEAVDSTSPTASTHSAETVPETPGGEAWLMEPYVK